MFFSWSNKLMNLNFKKKNYNLSQKNKLATRALKFLTFFLPLLKLKKFKNFFSISRHNVKGKVTKIQSQFFNYFTLVFAFSLVFHPRKPPIRPQLPTAALHAYFPQSTIPTTANPAPTNFLLQSTYLSNPIFLCRNGSQRQAGHRLSISFEKALTLSYNVHLLRQIFELRHSPWSGKRRMKM